MQPLRGNTHTACCSYLFPHAHCIPILYSDLCRVCSVPLRVGNISNLFVVVCMLYLLFVFVFPCTLHSHIVFGFVTILFSSVRCRLVLLKFSFVRCWLVIQDFKQIRSCIAERYIEK